MKIFDVFSRYIDFVVSVRKVLVETTHHNHNIMLLSIQAMHNSSLFITLALTECVLLGYSGEEQLTTSIPAIPRQCNQCADPTSVVLMK